MGADPTPGTAASSLGVASDLGLEWEQTVFAIGFSHTTLLLLPVSSCYILTLSAFYVKTLIPFKKTYNNTIPKPS